MDAEKTWNNIISQLKVCAQDIATIPSNNREPRWFNAYIDNGSLFAQNSTLHNPPTQMTQRRIISRQDFESVYPYYHRWANGERHLRQEVRLISRNTAYIFALIANFE